MRIKQLCVLGGSGFVGSALVHRLSNAGYQVKVLTRRREASKHLILLTNMEVVECDVMNDAALSAQIKGVDAVINLTGILHETGNVSFDAVHAELPARLAQICVSQGVKRLLHMSALQASKDAPSAYLRSKAAGEAVVMDYAGKLAITIFRPSVIFGRGDSFLNLFAKLVKFLPVIFLAKPEAKFQPIYVEDVARVFVQSLENIETYNKAYDLGGPKVYSLRELVQLVANVLGVKRIVIGLSDSLSYLQASVLEFLPIKLMTRDNIRSMQVDNVCAGTFPAIFSFQPTALEAVAVNYLANDNPRASYDRFRAHAGR